MLDIKFPDFFAHRESVKYLSIAWNGDIEIFLHDPTMGEHQEDFDRWKNWCGRNYDKIIEDVTIGNHVFDEDFFHVKKTDVSELIKNKNGGNIKIVLIPKNGKAIEIKIGDMIIPKEFVQLIKCLDNRITIILQQPDNENESVKKFKEHLALSGFYDGKEVNNVKLGKHLFENQTFGFSSTPDLKIPGVELSKNIILLTKINN